MARETMESLQILAPILQIFQPIPFKQSTLNPNPWLPPKSPTISKPQGSQFTNLVVDSSANCSSKEVETQIRNSSPKRWSSLLKTPPPSAGTLPLSFLEPTFNNALL
ncbi:hypothetical protein AQUCO_06300002v1 [Aquilegia coerulea]|uniref:Uncharacterized protein n=1 Tax=Aquilegia coerulea TaxID=218851 RepID=A0A2G5CCM5_AQUCA|nr:hypothetical protein AQUCO_06300002v1 [Aquilegia coerulea]